MLDSWERYELTFAIFYDAGMYPFGVIHSHGFFVGILSAPSNPVLVLSLA